MRAEVDPILARGRDGVGPYRTTAADGLQGRFVVRFTTTARVLLVLASDGRDWAEAGLPGVPWEHVSVSLLLAKAKTPTWGEMAWVKGLFWRPDETVMQLHVPEADHVNFHSGCLHLWRPVGLDIPVPPAITVGPKA